MSDRTDPWPDVPRSKPLEATNAPEPPELVEQATEGTPDDLCVCKHERRGHHRLCNGHVGKWWCTCRAFVAQKETS